MKYGLKLNNGVTDTLESSSVLIYFSKCMSLYTQNVGRTPQRFKDWFKVDEKGAGGVVNKSSLAEEINE